MIDANSIYWGLCVCALVDIFVFRDDKKQHKMIFEYLKVWIKPFENFFKICIFIGPN